MSPVPFYGCVFGGGLDECIPVCRSCNAYIIHAAHFVLAIFTIAYLFRSTRNIELVQGHVQAQYTHLLISSTAFP